MKTIQKQPFGAMVVLLTTTLLPFPVYAFRCGSDVVSEGDHLYEVLEKCGDPAFADHRVEYYSLGYGYYSSQQIPIEVDEWVYDFGPRKFKRFLRFENSILKKIDTLDYGD